MTKTKSTKRALLSSVLALMVCIAMLIGSTFAWFTDNVSSTGNKIQSGTLKVDLELLDKASGAWNSIKEDKTALFKGDKWEPGYTEVKVLRVVNDGSLALKWKAALVFPEELSILADAIDVYVMPYGVRENATGVAYPTDRNLEGYLPAGTVREFAQGGIFNTKGVLKEGETAYLGFALKMREEAGNQYQGLELSGAFDIQILATQYTYEEDSYGNEYDVNATYPVISQGVQIPDNATAPESVGTDDIKTELPADLLNALPNNVEELSLAHTEPKVEADGTVTFDSVEFMDQDGNIVDLSALGNDKPYTVSINVGNKFAVGTVVKIYHDDVQLTEGVVDANGDITYQTTHFCEVSISEKINVTVVFTDGYTKNFTSLASAMRYGYSGGAKEEIIVNEDITESMDQLEGNIVCGKAGGVTITNTLDDNWVYCDSTNFTIGEGVTYKVVNNSGLFVYGNDCVINGTVVTDAYYQRYAGSKLTINAPGSMKVNTETFILRYTDGDANAGIYINGDSNEATVEFQLAVAYFYQGMIHAKDATLKVGTYWQTNGTDGAGSANLVLDNSKLTVTVNEHNFTATGNSSVTLKNGSVLDVAGGIETTNEINCDATSVVKKAR